MFKSLLPLGDRVLVRKANEDLENVQGGVILTLERDDSYILGEVVQCGPGKNNTVPMSVKTGDTVLFGKYAGTHLNKEFLVIREEEILGIVEKS